MLSPARRTRGASARCSPCLLSPTSEAGWRAARVNEPTRTQQESKFIRVFTCAALDRIGAKRRPGAPDPRGRTCESCSSRTNALRPASLRRACAKHGHAVDVAGDGRRRRSAGSSGVYDVVILDLLLPMKGGLTSAANCARPATTVPVLMLTARDAVDDRIVGLDAGADDYLTKPFHFGELLARVRALTTPPSAPDLARARRVRATHA